MFKDKLFISSTLPYSNGLNALTGGSPCHIGHAFEMVISDCIARYYRIALGHDNVRFCTGLDEHGTKILECAQSLNMQPQEYCDKMAEKWIELYSRFQIQYDIFYRTSDIEHKKKALAYLMSLTHFSTVDNEPKIYLSKYTDLYCKGCESFKLKKDLTDGKCEQHPSIELEEITEENYFFRLTAYAKSCVPDDILVDNSKRPELDNLIENAQDMSISRNKEKVSWAIPIPDTDQTMYVWWDAIANYVFAAGYIPYMLPSSSEFKEFMSWWSNSCVVAGPDNLRFQALLLPALLAAGGLPSPTKVLIHGTILDETGAKMSKSEGNVIDPYEQLEKFGLNALRYYLVAGLNTFANSKYSESDLISKFNSDIVDGYGNLMARTLHLIDIKEIQIETGSATLTDEITEKFAKVKEEFESGNIKQAYASVKAMVDWANLYITENKPYSKDCPNPSEVLNNVYFLLLLISPLYAIAMPESAHQIHDALRDKKKVILYKKLEKATSPIN